MFFLGAILGRCITFFRGSPIEPPRVQHEKPFLDNPRKAHDVYQEWLEDKKNHPFFTPFQALPPPFRKKKKQRSFPYLVLLGQVSSCWMALASIFSPRCRERVELVGPSKRRDWRSGHSTLEASQWPLTAFRVVRIICNKGKEQKLVDIDKYRFCSEIA